MGILMGRNNYATSIVFKRKFNLYLMATMCCTLHSPISYAQDINLRLKVILNQLTSQTKMVQALCSLSHEKNKAVGSDYILPINGRFDDYINVPVTIYKPLTEYQNIRCEIRLCSSTNKLKKCSLPIADSKLNKSFKPYNAYADNAFNRINAEQPLAESLILIHTPPPSYQIADKNNQNKKQAEKAPKSFANRAPAIISGTASAVNDSGAVTETVAAVADLVTGVNFTSVTGITVGLVGLAGSKLLGFSDNKASKALGDLVGAGFTIVGIYVAGTATAAATASATTLLPAAAVLTGSYSFTENLDAALDGSGKEGNTSILTALEFYFPYDNGDTDEYLAAVARSKAQREAAGKNKQNTQTQDTNLNSDDTGVSSSGTFIEDLKAAGLTGFGGSGRNSGSGTSSGQTGSQNNNENDSESGSRQNQTTEEPSVGQESIDNLPGGAGTEATEQDTNTNTGVGVVIESHSNSDGSYGYTTMVYEDTADGGKRYVDTIETTCVGGNCVSIGSDGKAETHRDNSGGTAPANGTTVAVTVGSGDSDSGSDDDTSSDDSGSDDSSDDDNGDDCTAGDSNCENESEEPAEDEESETTDTETSENSTPNPNEQDSVGDGLAWAMQNPDNPLAKQILKDAANAIIENSGYCQLGCADATNDGGLLWAMLNPANPIAQAILATAAESINSNSGNGQAGGANDNPAIGLASAEDIYRLEFILAGSGVIDPVDGEGGNTPDDPTTGAPITGGGNPVSTQSQIETDLYNQNTNDGESEDEGEGGIPGELEINIDQQNIRSRIR